MRCSSTLLLPKLFAKTLNVSKYECYPFGNVHNQPLLVQKLSTFSQEVSFNGLSKFRPFLKLSPLFFERKKAMYYLFWPWSRCLKNDGRLAEFFCMHDCTLDYDPHLQLPLDIVVRPRHWVELEEGRPVSGGSDFLSCCLLYAITAITTSIGTLYSLKAFSSFFATSITTETFVFFCKNYKLFFHFFSYHSKNWIIMTDKVQIPTINIANISLHKRKFSQSFSFFEIVRF